jgi:predicted alpha/beta-hydrolase family hydrolase
VNQIEIPWEGGSVTGRIAGEGGDGILLAHGAGTNQDHPSMVLLRDALAGLGLKVMTFNYPYTERGARSPDRAERLVACHRGAAAALAAMVDRMFLAGRSMGGRMATYLAAEGYPAAGCILYAYPLHPAGKPDRLRVAHFPDVTVPLLFFQGTRDALSTAALFDRYIRPLPNATVVMLEGADHSFRGRGWDPEGVAGFLASRSAEWVQGLSSGRTSRPRP